jgi:imidazolonepropionase-like amidohydrolase
LNSGGPPPPITTDFLLTPLLFVGMQSLPAYLTVLESFDPARCEALADLMADAGIWHVPTLIRHKTMGAAGSAEFRQDPELKYLDAKTRAHWEQIGQEFDDKISAEGKATFKNYYAKEQQFTKLLADKGVRMLTGSDLGGIWVLPGFGLQDEFVELTKAGLTPLQILQASTISAAKFLGRHDMGLIEAGKRADMVLLDANPLEDPANFAAIWGVVRNGHYLSHADLDRQLAGLRGN